MSTQFSYMHTLTLQLCERLATKVDQIRASYWWYTARRLEQAVSESSRSTHPQEQSVEC